jgi:hypothetical protein
MSNNEISLCEFAQQRHRNAALWLNLWTILLFIFGASLVILLVICMMFFLRQNWLSGSLSTVSTIVDGAAIKWVLARRNEAKSEEKAACDDVLDKCKSRKSVDIMRANLKLFKKIL